MINYEEAMRIMKVSPISNYFETKKFMADLLQDLECGITIVPHGKLEADNDDPATDFLCGITALYLAAYRKGIQHERSQRRLKEAGRAQENRTVC